LSDELKTLLASAVSPKDTDREMNEKVCVLLDMMSEVKKNLSVLAKDIKRLRSIATDPNFRMPTTFIIKIEVPSNESLIDYIRRCVTTTYTVTFVCPVTLKEVPCGPDPKKGYEVTFPSSNIKQLIPVLKAGLVVYKVALATQVLGGLVPDLSGFMPGFANNVTSKAQEYAETFHELCEKLNVDVDGKADDLSKAADDEAQITQSDENFTLVYENLRAIEGLTAGQRLKLTGLQYVQSGKDSSSAWVSEAGLARFHKEGKEALLNVTQAPRVSDHPNAPAGGNALASFGYYVSAFFVLLFSYIFFSFFGYQR